MSRHQRRLQVLKVKRGNERHSDFLYTIENLMSIAEFNTMTLDEMIIHLFAETADNTMSRLVLEILAGTKPLVAELRIKIKEKENSI